MLSQVPKPEARAVLTSVIVGAALLAIKFIAYFLTGSAAIFSDAMESIVNVLASTFALFALIQAHRPADLDHPYGHGKVEFMSAFVEGGMIAVAAIVIAVKTVDTMLFREVRVDRLGAGLWLIGAAMIVNGAVGIGLVRIGRRYGSFTLEADGKHLLSDAVTTAGVLLALLAVRMTGWVWADPLMALLIAIYIGWTGWGLIWRAIGGLMDQQDQSDALLLAKILDAHLAPHGKLPQICSYHKLRHRHSGRYHWVDFHLMVQPSLTVDQAHQIASAIEYEIEQSLGEGNATAHVEPCADPDCAHGPQRQN